MENTASNDERTMAMLCHLSAFAGVVFPFGNVIAPLIIWLMKKDESPYIDYHGKESLNFQIAFTVYALISAILIIVAIGALLLMILGVAGLILIVIASIKAKDGEMYRYPFIFRVI